MEIKKNKQIDEHKRSSMYLMIGLVISASVSLVAFEWKSSNTPSHDDYSTGFYDHDKWDGAPPTIIEPPKPPVLQQPKVIEIDNDEEDLIEDIDFDLDTDMSEETIIDTFVPDEGPEDPEPYTPFIVSEEEASFPGGNKAGEIS